MTGWRGRPAGADLRGTDVAIEPLPLGRYVTEPVFRYDEPATKDNPSTDADRFTLAASQISGRRLIYAGLTGKVPPSHSDRGFAGMHLYLWRREAFSGSRSSRLHRSSGFETESMVDKASSNAR